MFALVFWLVPGNDANFWLGFVLLFLSVLGAPLVAAVLYRDAKYLQSMGAQWQPNWVAYLGVPVAAGGFIYLARAFLLPSESPFGDAVYGFMFGLWVVSVVYIYRRHLRVDTS